MSESMNPTQDLPEILVSTINLTAGATMPTATTTGPANTPKS